MRSIAPYELKIPIERKTKVNLAVQVANGLQNAIQAGDLPVGARLPKVREIAGAVGVSYVIASRAVQSLAESRFLEVRRKTGIFVASPPDQVWNAHALYITPPMQSFYFAARQNALLRNLADDNIRVSTLVYASDKPKEILSQIRATLETSNFSMVICALPIAGLSKICKKHDVHMTVFGSKENNVDGCVTSCDKNAHYEMAEHCIQNGVTQTAILALNPDQIKVAKKIFSEKKIKLENIPISEYWTKRVEGTGVIEHLGYEAACRLVQKKALPQLLYVTDDYLARGCITGFLQHGVRMPEDIQLIIHGNRKHLPILDRLFTRIEVDPDETGKAMAELTREVLGQKTKHFVKHNIEAKFIGGETTGPVLK